MSKIVLSYYQIYFLMIVVYSQTVFCASGCGDKFWCSNNYCIDTAFVCDGQNNCGESSDERSCTGCSVGSFSCNNGNSTHSDCIDPVLVCDKTCDCDTCEDEKECYYDRPPRPPKPKCDSLFWCSNDKCIPTAFVCIGMDACGDNSDERSCSACEDSSNETSCFECRPGTFLCPKSNVTDYKCVDADLVCDKYCDCDTCEDEKGCYYDKPQTTPRPTKPNCIGKFWCSNNYCLYYTSSVCDGLNNCGESSDERSCIGCESGSFSCNNGNSTHSDCIDPDLVCDKTCDCDTCEDEKECYYDRIPREPKPKCNSQFWCSNDLCISTHYVCNDINYCGDWSDERSCNGCRPGTFFCPNNNNTNPQCIDSDLVCDKFCDCDTCEDEKECYYDLPPRPPKPKCNSQFWCSNDRCRSFSFVCDGYDNCGDGSDERSCDGCGKGNFLCPNNNGTKPKCINPDLVCDKFCDCDTCEDEIECYYDKPTTTTIATTTVTPRPTKQKCSSLFWCSNNRCISKNSVCDGYDGCWDNSDERSCAGCRWGSFSCQNGSSTNPKCIEPFLVCDEVCDCENCEDEKECYYSRPTKSRCSESFWCSNDRCSSVHRVCNGIDDCKDNSDERSCEGCLSGSFACKDGTCIYPDLVCDTVCDCEDCNDEQGCFVPDEGGINIVVAIVVSVCVVALLIIISVCARKYKSKKRAPSIDRNNIDLFYVTSEQQSQEQYHPEMDLPPDYETVNDGPVFSVSPSLYSDDSDDGLPAYNEVNVPMGGSQLRGEVNASMTTEDEAEPPPPSYDTVADNFSANITNSESNSTDEESLRFRRSSSCYSNTVSHDL